MHCAVCNKDLPYGSQYMNAPLCSDECHYQYHWLEIWRKKEEYYIINGTSYKQGTEPHTFLGFDGQTFFIKHTTPQGKVEYIQTSDLWTQGEVPIEWRQMLPDNSKFITREEFFNLGIDKNAINHTEDTRERIYNLWLRDDNDKYHSTRIGSYCTKTEALQAIAETEEYKKKQRYCTRAWFATDWDDKPDESCVIIDYGEPCLFFEIRHARVV